MSTRIRVDLFHVGPQKSGTTWIYSCLQEHPQVACPPKDSIHYYDMFFSRGPEWYATHFQKARDGQLLFDPTASYIRSPLVPERIHDDNPDAKIVLCLRSPIERAYSHYWHEKKKLRFDYTFSEVLENYDLFSSWVEPAFYARHVRRFLEYFPRERILCQRFELLQNDARAFLTELLLFIGVDAEFSPSVIDQKINPAGVKRSFYARAKGRLGKELGRLTPGIMSISWLASKLSYNEEYERGVPADVREQLLHIFEPEVRCLEELLDIDLSGWMQ
jgi:hypothetical protein